jgi:penicillin-binding protein 2
MVENSGFGASVAGPIASLMAEQFLTGRIADTPEREWVRARALNARSEPIPAGN